MSGKSDIVQDLREMSTNLLKPYSQLAREAADEIERLRKALEKDQP